MAQNWLTGEIPAGYQAPADTQFSAKTDGDIPITEAERNDKKESRKNEGRNRTRWKGFSFTFTNLFESINSWKAI